MLSREILGTDLPATLAAQGTPLDGGRVFAIVNPIIDLPGRDIDDQLTKLDRVARAFEALGCHALNMARSGRSANPASRSVWALLQSN